MAKTFGFNDDELKLLLVAVRHMRRTFDQARKAAPEPQPAAAVQVRVPPGGWDGTPSASAPSKRKAPAPGPKLDLTPPQSPQ